MRTVPSSPASETNRPRRRATACGVSPAVGDGVRVVEPQTAHRVVGPAGPGLERCRPLLRRPAQLAQGGTPFGLECGHGLVDGPAHLVLDAL
ncbi:hypothetical protein RKD22_000150 [Streptomyces pristinaespiralis]